MSLSEKNLSFQILRSQRRIIILRRRNPVLEDRAVGLLPRLIILIGRISCMSDSCYKNTSFFPQEQNYFVKNYLMVYSSEKKHCSPPKIVSFWVSSWEFLSFTQERIFVFKLIVLHKRLTLLVWRITFKSILADKVFVLFWGLNILLRRIFCLYWVLWSYWKDWFSSNTVNYIGSIF